MSALEESLVGYLRIRRALGYKLMQTETLLGQFVDYLDQHGEQRISTERAVAWATLPGASDIWHYQRLMIVRGFASYLQGVSEEPCKAGRKDSSCLRQHAAGSI